MGASFKNSITTLLIFLVLALLPISCDVVCNNPCGCGPAPQVRNFNIISFSSASYNLNGIKVSNELFLPYNEVYKSIKVEDFEFVSQAEPDSKGNFPGLAFACSPVPPKSTNSLLYLEIYNSNEVTLGDGTVLKVGEVLNDYFEISSDFTTSPKSIADFFTEKQEIYSFEPFKLYFIKNPEKEIVITFSVRFFLENQVEKVLNEVILSIK
ncbi:hypothetical protein JYB62_06480 [Algoriphagus lutimaris]|uniref:hypothetical protein n=1 Tax=Algoriphagus lutimaris TaxID=613197 RepID=UPI00196B7707|nr:hypothetical protein [Algoriphagus lutimaris]MBN3519646.1 hypothetical protein [Algoriphagus lutimaris]